MFKKILIALVMVSLLAYLVYALFFMNPDKKKDMICKEVRIEIADSLDQHFLTSNEIRNYLSQAGMLPVGKDLGTINLLDIENKLKENRLIRQVNSYKTMDGAVQIKIVPRAPLLRIFSVKGNYYIDNTGEKMPVPGNYAAYVPVASGFIEEEYAKKQLYEFALFLQQNKFWNSQIKQIYVAQNGDVELTPAVGNHQIILGKIEDYKENLEKLRLFYEKGLSKVGWNRYSTINLKFRNQVVCTKRE